jgi:uncharacterized RDD family membrane protein YckC
VTSDKFGNPPAPLRRGEPLREASAYAKATSGAGRLGKHGSRLKARGGRCREKRRFRADNNFIDFSNRGSSLASRTREQMDPNAPLPGPPTLPPTPPDFRKAGFWRRTGALFIDWIILAIVCCLLGFFFGESFLRMGGWERFIGFAIALFYFVPLNSRLGAGRTIGKRALGIRVVSRTGEPLSVGRSFVRAFVLLLPFFVNGAPIPMALLQSGRAIVFGEIVFGLGLSISYLIAFNTKTRQSLHDLVVGSYVVRVGSEAADKPKIWGGHYVVVVLIFILVGVVPMLLANLMKKWLGDEIVAAYEAIQKQPEVAIASVYSGQTVFWDNKNGQRVVTGVTVNIRLNRRVENFDAEADKLVGILLQKYPEAGTKDSITIGLSVGYELGIWSRFNRQGFSYPPEQWRQRVEARK